VAVLLSSILPSGPNGALCGGWICQGIFLLAGPRCKRPIRGEESQAHPKPFEQARPHVDPWLVRFHWGSICNAGGKKNHCRHPSHQNKAVIKAHWRLYGYINFSCLGRCAGTLDLQPPGSGSTDKQLYLSIRGISR